MRIMFGLWWLIALLSNVKSKISIVRAAMGSQNSRVRILVFSQFFIPGFKGGGPIKTIKNLVERASDDLLFKVITTDRDLGDKKPYASVNLAAWNKVGKALVFYIQPGVSGYFQVFREIKNREYDLIYLNSFFSVRFSLFPLMLSRIFKRKVILAPRGEFSEGALALKYFKKRTFLEVFKRTYLYKNVVFQASTEFESKDIRKALGDSVDIFVAENVGEQNFAQEILAGSPGVLRVVFVSRISKKKNLLTALEIIGGVNSPVSFDIYGPIEDHDYWRECEAVMANLPHFVSVTYKGELAPSEVVSTLSGYDAFLFPTKGENYGHVITEALSAALPIVIADTTPWRNLQAYGIGWDLPLSKPSAFSAILDELAKMPAEEYLRMRQNVLAWAKRRFSQSSAVQDNIAMFKHVYQKK